MRIGICAYWFNRGQGVVARQIRSALDELGHETFVLARPTRAKNIRPSFVDRGGVWDQPRVTEASAYRIPANELVGWGREHELDVALFDQNYEFEAIEALRDAGVATVGRFVWEQFAPRARRTGAPGVRDHLLGDGLRARAVRADGHHEPPRALGHPPGAPAVCPSLD